MSAVPETFVKAKVPQELKDTANSLLESMGLSMTDYIKLALISMVNERGVPFPIKAPAYAPNATTIEAMQAVERGEVYRADSLKEILDEGS